MDVYVVTTTQKWIGKTLYDDGHRIMGIFNAHETAKLFIDLLVKDNEKDYADGIGGYGVVEERPIELSEQINLVGSEELREQRNQVLAEYAGTNKTVSQLIDLALLGNGMLKGEALSQFIKRSVELIG